jgi:PAS domain S-box-containing protein
VNHTTVSERALVLAPLGRDASIATGMLRESGIEAAPCGSLDEMIGELNVGAAFVIVTEEAIATADLKLLSRWIAAQEEWSDLPFILLTNRGGGLERNPAAGRHLDLLGNVTFLERPFHPTTLVSLARSSLRARRRQYEARARLIALRDSEQQLRTLFDTMDEGFAVIDFIDGPHGPLSDYVHVQANPAYLTNAGIPDIVGKRLREIVSEDEAHAWAEIYRDVLVTGKSVRFERELVETGRYLDLAAFRVSSAERRVAVLFKDVSARKQAEAALRESEERFRLTADAVPQIVWITDSAGRVEFFNRQWFDYTGATEAPASAAQVTEDYVHPEDRAATIDAFNEAGRTGNTFLVEHRIRSCSGEYRWFLVRAEPARDAATDQVTRWFGASVDIHELKRAEARLRELNDTLEAQVEARSAERDRLWNLSQDLLARADHSGMISAVSPAWTRALGWTEAELLSSGYANFIHPEDAASTLESLGQMAETGQPIRYENRIVTRDGGWKWIEWTVAPEPDGVNFIAVGRDLSFSKAREAELHAAQEALRQSQKMEAMGSLTGGVAHDFNNLLTPIVGALDMLVRRGLGSDRERRLIDGALQSAERAKTLVQRLLAFARRQPLQPVAVDVAGLVAGMTELIGSTLGPTIEVGVDLAPDLPPAKADPNQLEMALLNLAVNARDAMPGGGELTILASRESVRTPHSGLKLGHYVRLAVRDSGEGMDEETRRRAIEPFFSTKGIGKGTGLGLSMVHGLAAQLGGGLTIESAPERGTTVELWLPISPEAVASEEREPAARFARSGGRGTALLVDDEDLVRMTTADMLTDLGFEVVEANSAEDAMRLLHAGATPDLLVTDHLMPGMSGADLAGHARALRPKLPVLIVSGYADADGIAPDLPRLTKPFRNAELAASVAAILPKDPNISQRRGTP